MKLLFRILWHNAHLLDVIGALEIPWWWWWWWFSYYLVIIRPLILLISVIVITDAAVASDVGEQAAVSTSSGRARRHGELAGLWERLPGLWSVLCRRTHRLQPRTAVPQHSQWTSQVANYRPHRRRLARFCTLHLIIIVFSCRSV